MTPHPYRGAPGHAAPRARHLGRTAIVLGTVAGAVLLPTGIAQAYWKSIGPGTGSATGGTLSALTALSSTAAATGTLYPGGAGTLVVSVSNPNNVAITVTSLAAGSGSVGSTGGLGTCTNAALTVVPQSGLSTVIAGGSSATLTLPNAVSMGSADSGCQGATFTVPVIVTGKTS